MDRTTGRGILRSSRLNPSTVPKPNATCSAWATAGTAKCWWPHGITRVTPLDFTSYPISHSLVAALVWGTLFAAAYYLLRRYPKGAWICGAAVLSHWVLDALVHRPDLPLVPGCAVRIGLGLYVRTTRALDRVGSVALWSLVGFLLIMYLGNLFGPPPPSATAIAWAGQAQWLLVIWAFWIDRHRAVGTSTKD